MRQFRRFHQFSPAAPHVVSKNGPTRVRRKAVTWPWQPSSAAEVARDGADIGALAAFGLEHRLVARRVDETQCVDGHRARR